MRVSDSRRGSSSADGTNGQPLRPHDPGDASWRSSQSVSQDGPLSAHADTEAPSPELRARPHEPLEDITYVIFDRRTRRDVRKRYRRVVNQRRSSSSITGRSSSDADKNHFST